MSDSDGLWSYDGEYLDLIGGLTGDYLPRGWSLEVLFLRFHLGYKRPERCGLCRRCYGFENECGMAVNDNGYEKVFQAHLANVDPKLYREDYLPKKEAAIPKTRYARLTKNRADGTFSYRCGRDPAGKGFSYSRSRAQKVFICAVTGRVIEKGEVYERRWNDRVNLHLCLEAADKRPMRPNKTYR